MLTVSINPKVSFVVDGKNKIASVQYENSDAGTIFANVNFVGKDVNSAIQIFIEQSAISGHLNLTGEQVDLVVNGSEEKDINKLKTTATLKVKEVFDSLGVHVEVMATELDKTARHSSLVATASLLAPEKSTVELKEMTDSELITLIKEKQKEYEGLAYTQVETLKNSFTAANNAALAAIESLKDSVASSQEMLDAIGETINEYKEKIDALGINSALVDTFKAYLASSEAQFNEVKQAIEKTQTELEAKVQTFLSEKRASIESAKAQYETKKAELVALYTEQVNSAKANFTSHLDTAKTNGTITEEQYNYWTSLLPTAE